MPISNTPFLEPKNPTSELQNLMKILKKGSIEAYFTTSEGEKTVSREFVAMYFQDYTIAQQNPQVMNKLISLDTKLDKALLEYASDVKMLIASITQIGKAQQSIEEPINMSPAGGMSPEAGDEGLGGVSSHDRELPVTGER
jgi:hypothetical protein